MKSPRNGMSQKDDSCLMAALLIAMHVSAPENWPDQLCSIGRNRFPKVCFALRAFDMALNRNGHFPKAVQELQRI